MNIEGYYTGTCLLIRIYVKNADLLDIYAENKIEQFSAIEKTSKVGWILTKINSDIGNPYI